MGEFRTKPGHLVFVVSITFIGFFVAAITGFSLRGQGTFQVVATGFWLVLALECLFGAITAFETITLDKFGLELKRPFALRRWEWSEIDLISTEGAADFKVILHREGKQWTVEVSSFENGEQLREALLARRAPVVWPRVVDQFRSRLGLSLTSIGIVVAMCTVMPILFLCLSRDADRGASEAFAGCSVGGGLVIFGVLATNMYRLHIDESGVSRIFYWGTETSIKFAEVTEVNLSTYRQRGGHLIEITRLTSPNGKISIVSSLPGYGEIRDLVLGKVRPEVVRDRR